MDTKQPHEQQCGSFTQDQGKHRSFTQDPGGGEMWVFHLKVGLLTTHHTIIYNIIVIYWLKFK